ncbi:thyroglobulin-like [Mizuhopecten yessoensis]|uniref:Thyroglobulin n=1 Tax=Mizuhopecten yessoensis TaxID=6573 RepID=A0A210QMR5_MIZYE|nr:thyroglobulin-like [Mizuhopecten yessoensis]OWF50022.1 Thyroglobulin [Mizuhopecten yessoensis]
MKGIIIALLVIATAIYADETDSGTDAPTDVTDPPEPVEATQACQREYDYIEELENQVWEETGVRPSATTKPQCLEDGTYAPRQCMYGHCRCVAADGTILTKQDFSEAEGVDTDCSCARAQHEYSGRNIRGKLFRCTAIGSYDPIQCTGSVCFCADVRGQQLGEETVNIGLIETLNC